MGEPLFLGFLHTTFFRLVSLGPSLMIWNEDCLCGSGDASCCSAVFESWCWWAPGWCRTARRM